MGIVMTVLTVFAILNIIAAIIFVIRRFVLKK